MLPLAGIEAWIIDLSTHVHLVWFVFLGEVIEEVISPIPSQAVLLTGGSLAQAKEYGLWAVVFFSLLASFAKSITTMGYYYLADKLEDRLVPRFGKYLGLTHEGLESIGKKLSRNSPQKEFWSIFALRCLPILPSAPVSLACGAIKVNAKRFFWATVAGNTVRGGMIFLTGFLGFDVFQSLVSGVSGRDVWLVLAILAALVGIIAWSYWQRYRKERHVG